MKHPSPLVLSYAARRGMGMWTGAWREEAWSRLGEPWDLIVVGGGITGAGVAREAACGGLRVLLVERRDFAWGTSSRSSKLVHGGLRYLRQGRLRIVREGVRERERLIREAPGLVEPVGFVFAQRRGERPSRALNRAALLVYALLAGRRMSRFLPPERLREFAPDLSIEGLLGGHGYEEARVDDARLVLRVLGEAVAHGAVALNYVGAEDVLTREGRVAGVRLRDAIGEQTAEVFGRVVINATGAWADDLGERAGAPRRLRPLRGSHLIVPGARLPLARALSFAHPDDRRPVFALPWEGATVIGTTDLDYDGPLDRDLAITPGEVAYLLAAVNAHFPALRLGVGDVVSTWSGVRPMIDAGDGAPSAVGRAHAVWEDRGLVTVTGGKLTIFHQMVRDTLVRVGTLHPELGERLSAGAGTAVDRVPLVPDDLPGAAGLDAAERLRLVGRYGARAAGLLACAGQGELDPIPGTPYRWAELRWAARAEAVVHLEDLLLRRLRLGLLVPEGGAALLPQVRSICQGELAWDDARWAAERAAYLATWQAAYAPPTG